MQVVDFYLRIPSFLGFLLGALCAASAAEQLGGESKEETAIRQAAAAYVNAIQSRDIDALASHWTENGTYVDSTGTSTNARAAIKELANRPAASTTPAPAGSVCESTIRFLAADAAIEEGHCTANGSGVEFVAIWVNRNGKWLLDHLNERLHETAQPAAPLDGLAWMVGTWIGEGEGLTITFCANWSENRSFLVRRLVIDREGVDVMSATQRIGWDPATETIRSWTFNSDGSVVKGRWLLMDGAWVVQNTGVLADKAKYSSVNFWLPEGDDRCALKTSHVERNDEPAAESTIEFRRVAQDGVGDLP